MSEITMTKPAMEHVCSIASDRQTIVTTSTGPSQQLIGLIDQLAETAKNGKELIEKIVAQAEAEGIAKKEP